LRGGRAGRVEGGRACKDMDAFSVCVCVCMLALP
jgi:hypothetical protein